MAATKTFLGGITVGAGLAYFLDPERGADRREQWAQRLAPLWDDARQLLQSGAGGSPTTRIMRYGARIGDLPGMGTVTLESSGGIAGPAAAGASALRVVGIVLGLYGSARCGGRRAENPGNRAAGAGCWCGSLRARVGSPPGG